MDSLKALLEDLIHRTPEVYGVILVTTDGFPVSYAFRGSVDQAEIDKQAAVIASLASLARRSTESMDLGSPEEILITAEMGRMFVYRLEDIAALGVVTAKDVTAGFVLLRIRQMLPVLMEEFRNSTNLGGQT